jgi:hypothetical protein
MVRAMSELKIRETPWIHGKRHEPSYIDIVDLGAIRRTAGRSFHEIKKASLNIEQCLSVCFNCTENYLKLKIACISIRVSGRWITDIDE